MIKLMQGDCLELMKDIPDKSIDLIITDPPYEFNPKNNGGGGMYNTRHYHKEILSKHGGKLLDIGIEDKTLEEFKRILKAMNLVIFVNQFQFPQILNWCVKNNYRYTINVWHKTNPIPATNNKYLDDLEFILVIRENGKKMYGNYDTKKRIFTSPINKKDKKLYEHPTVKPVELITKYVINHSLENEIILDPFMGSGTAGVACVNTNRHFIGMELDEKYFNIAKERIESYDRARETGNTFDE